MQLHNLTLTESLTDSPSKFAVASGSTGNWDRYYVMEAPSAEIKEEWMECIKKILLKDLEMMKGEGNQFTSLDHVMCVIVHSTGNRRCS